MGSQDVEEVARYAALLGDVTGEDDHGNAQRLRALVEESCTGGVQAVVLRRRVGDKDLFCAE